MRILLIILAILALGVGASVLAVYSYGQFAERSLGPPSYALPPGDTTPLDLGVAALVEENGGRNGLVLMSNSYDAFAARVLAARAAGRSLDLMYYIWEPDLTGNLMSQEVLMAADRGVRVRMLLDDFTTHGTVVPYLALDSHPNIEVRMFNPTRARDNALRRGLEMVLRLFSMTRRMHNKGWIADGQMAIVGGRNIGDDYFDATESHNFSDLDLLMVGPIVNESEDVFDQFWNSTVVLPITALARAHQQPNLDGFRAAVAKTAESPEAKPYLDRVRERASAIDSLAGPGTIHWTNDAGLYSDPPQKALGLDEDQWLFARLSKAMETAKTSLEITSPYFVTGQQGTERLVALAQRGVDVSVLTNSLAATDAFPTGFSGYANYRAPLLAGGVKLYELMPQTERSYTLLAGASKLALHSKAFTMDDDAGFVGSYNVDPRSATLNTEMGVFFRDAALAGQLNQLFATDSAPDRAFSVSLDANGQLRWEGEVDGTMETYDHDPDTSPFRRFVVWVLSKLPIESQI